MKKVNYLNNKDLLLEINKSKISFCTFIDEKYQDYDIIIRSLDEVNDDLVQQGKKNRMERIAHFAHKAAIREDKKMKLDEFRFPLEEIDDQDVVIRLMTNEHIPTNKKGPVSTQFPPFKHYALDQEGNLMEVGKSHYNGDKFSTTHGKVTENLGRMYMMLVQRYSQRFNWRGYCVDEETEALTQRGWLKGDEINEDDIILSYDNGEMKWSKIKSIFRDDYDGLMFKLDSIGMDALVTPGHKLVTKRGLVAVEHLLETDQVILMGDGLDNLPGGPHNLRFVEPIPSMAVSVKDIDFHSGKGKPTHHYTGKVWCPETEYGSFVARRNGKVYLTGNSYVDEMRGQAIVQLVAVGLKFDESKSQNPFGYLTTVCANSFLGILNAEKKVQTIRDDILESNGMSPSFTRQLDNDLFNVTKDTDSN